MAEKKALGFLLKVRPMITQCLWRTGILLFGSLNLIYNIYEVFAPIKYDKNYNYPHNPFDFRNNWFQIEYGQFRYWSTKAVKVPWLVVNAACMIGLALKSPALLQLHIGFSAALVTILTAGVIRREHTRQYYMVFDLVRITIFSIIYYIYANQLENERETKVEQTEEKLFTENSSETDEIDEENASEIVIAS